METKSIIKNFVNQKIKHWTCLDMIQNNRYVKILLRDRK